MTTGVRSNPAPPLKVWGIVFFLILTFVLSTVFYLYNCHKNYLKQVDNNGMIDRGKQLYQANSDRMHTFFSEVTPETISIAILGTSLVNKGVFYDNEMEKILNHTSPQNKYKILRITLGSGKLLEFKEVIETLLNQEITLLLIHSDMLLNKPRRQPTNKTDTYWNIYTDYLRYSLQRFNFGYSFYSRSLPVILEKTDYKTNSLPSGYTLPKSKKAYYQSFRTNPPPQLEQFLALKQQAASSNTTIMLLNIPRSPEAEVYLQKQQPDSTNKILASLQRQFQIRTINPSPTLTNQHFYEASHMNQQGRALFSASLCQEIIKFFQNDRS